MTKTLMPEALDAPGWRAKRSAAAKARRDRGAALRQVMFDALVSGSSIEEIAELRKVSPRTVRREVDRALDERRLEAPDRYIRLQVARLNKALRLADASLDRGELRAIGPMVKVVRALDRYHGLSGGACAATPAPADGLPALPAPLLQLTHAEPPFAEREPDESGISPSAYV
jgi:hypothetical protein